MNKEELKKLAPGDLLMFKSELSYVDISRDGEIWFDSLRQDKINKEFIFLFISSSDDGITLFDSTHGVCYRRKNFNGAPFSHFLSCLDVISRGQAKT